MNLRLKSETHTLRANGSHKITKRKVQRFVSQKQLILRGERQQGFLLILTARWSVCSISRAALQNRLSRPMAQRLFPSVYQPLTMLIKSAIGSMA